MSIKSLALLEECVIAAISHYNYPVCPMLKANTNEFMLTIDYRKLKILLLYYNTSTNITLIDDNQNNMSELFEVIYFTNMFYSVTH